MPLESLTDPDQCERLRDTLQPGQPVNFAITIEVILVDELGVGRRQLFGTGGKPFPDCLRMHAGPAWWSCLPVG
jgi:hypothetical protein